MCSGWFTTSLWLQPYDMESDQIFLYTGTHVTSTLDTTSMKLWFDSNTDKYKLELFYDKTHFEIQFYIDLYEWSHLVLTANLQTSEIKFYVNGQDGIILQTTAFLVDRMPPSPAASLTFFHIGVVGTFGIDDIQHHSSEKLPSDLYGKVM